MTTIPALIPNQPDGLTFLEDWSTGWESRWTFNGPCSPAVVDGKLRISKHAEQSSSSMTCLPIFVIDPTQDFEIYIDVTGSTCSQRWVTLYNGEQKYIGWYPDISGGILMSNGGTGLAGYQAGPYLFKFIAATNTTEFYAGGVLRYSTTTYYWNGVVSLWLHGTMTGTQFFQIAEVSFKQGGVPKVAAGAWDGYPWSSLDFFCEALSGGAISYTLPYHWSMLEVDDPGYPWQHNILMTYPGGEGGSGGGDEEDTGIGVLVPHADTDEDVDAVYESTGYRIGPDIELSAGWHWRSISIWKTGPLIIQIVDDQNTLVPNTYIPGNSTGIGGDVDLSALPDSYTSIRLKMSWSNINDLWGFIFYGFKVLVFPYTLTTAAKVDNTVVLTADEDATPYYSFTSSAGPFEEYTEPTAIPEGASMVWYYSEFDDYTEDVSSMQVGGLSAYDYTGTTPQTPYDYTGVTVQTLLNYDGGVQ